MSEFSGGWVMRAGLARILFRKPNLLLLDEPTNHLDLDANIWLRSIWPLSGCVLITSHDRAFLNQTATKVLAIERDEFVLLRGNYDDYLVARARALQVKEAASARQERQIQKQRRFIDRFRSKARRHPGAKPCEATGKIKNHRVARATKKVRYSFPEPPRSGSEVISLKT